MYKNIKFIDNIVIDYCKENKKNIYKYSIEDCIKLLEDENIYNYFNMIFKDKKEIKESEFSFCSDFVIDLIKIYLDNSNIMILDETLNYDYEKLKKNSDIYYLYLKDINKYPLLSSFKERELIEKYKLYNDKESKDILICSNQKLIIKYAITKTFDHTFLLDLIQEGNLALIETIEKFDLKFKCKFSTYAFWYIRAYIDCACIKNEIIQKPKYVADLEKKIRAYCYNIWENENRYPDEDELCNKFKITLNLLRNTLRDLSITSLNSPISDDSEEELLDFVKDSYNLENEVENNYLKKVLREEFNNLLNDQYIDILLKRKGLYDGRVWRLEEIAKEYNISKQAIEVKEKTAIKRLKKSKKLQELIKLD